MANKLTRLKVEVDTGMKDFVPKSYITEKDFKDFKGKSKIKPSITIRRQKFGDKFMSGSPSQEVESEFGIKFSKDQKGVFFRKRFKRGGDVMPARNKKNFRPTEKGTGKVKPGSKAAKRRKSFCARSAGQMKKFPKAAKDPNSRLRQARRRWKC